MAKATHWDVNVGGTERLLSALLGGALVLEGVRRHSLAGAALALAGGGLLLRGVSGHCSLYQARDASSADRGTALFKAAITIAKSPAEIYGFWREPGNLERVMKGFATVSAHDGGMRVALHGPLGYELTWDAALVEERAGELLRWRSTGETKLPNEMELSMKPGPEKFGTEVSLALQFEAPGGSVGAALLKKAGVVPRALARKILRNTKSLLETGEIPTLEWNPSGRGEKDAV